MNLWVARILGDHVKSFLWTNGILFIAGIAGFFFKLFPEEESKQIQARIKRLYLIFVSRPFLIWSFAVFLLASGFLTSIVIEKGDVQAAVRVNAASLGSLNEPSSRVLEKGEKSTRFLKFASPLGRTFQISADGYSPKPVRVFPWIGKTIRLDDLSPAPSLWVRFPVTLIHTLLDQCRLLICAGEDTLYNIQTENGYGSLQIGRKMQASESRLATWQKEASVYYNVEGEDLDLTLLGWQKVRHLEPAGEIDSGRELKFFLQHIPTGMTLAHGVHKPPGPPEIDILLRE